jgi:hypothetical protein
MEIEQKGEDTYKNENRTLTVAGEFRQAAEPRLNALLISLIFDYGLERADITHRNFPSTETSKQAMNNPARAA